MKKITITTIVYLKKVELSYEVLTDDYMTEKTYF